MNLNGQGKSVMLKADLNLVYQKVPDCFGQQNQNLFNQCPVPLNAQVKEKHVKNFAKVCIFFIARDNEIKLSGLKELYPSFYTDM